jgi:hypothetical protein
MVTERKQQDIEQGILNDEGTEGAKRFSFDIRHSLFDILLF